jgi:hypothetical protein
MMNQESKATKEKSEARNALRSSIRAKASSWLPELKLFQKVIPAIVVKHPAFSDREGKLADRLSYLQIGPTTQHQWLKFWLQICDDDKNFRLSYSQFLEYFNMEDCVWIRRTFDIMNYSLTGSVTFAEFLGFLAEYLVIDKDATVEFCFRLLSRRGTNYMKVCPSRIFSP